MAKAKATPKATAKAKGKVAKTAAKTTAKPPRMQLRAGVKAEVRTPPRSKKEPQTAPDPPSSGSSGTIGFARGTISALLTGLKYQARTAKGASPQQRQEAQQVLQEQRHHVQCIGLIGVPFDLDISRSPWQEYESADGPEKKRLILSKLQEYGVKNCSWVNSLSQTVETSDNTSETLRTNMYTRKLVLFR